MKINTQSQVAVYWPDDLSTKPSVTTPASPYNAKNQLREEQLQAPVSEGSLRSIIGDAGDMTAEHPNCHHFSGRYIVQEDTVPAEEYTVYISIHRARKG